MSSSVLFRLPWLSLPSSSSAAPLEVVAALVLRALVEGTVGLMAVASISSMRLASNAASLLFIVFLRFPGAGIFGGAGDIEREFRPIDAGGGCDVEDCRRFAIFLQRLYQH